MPFGFFKAKKQASPDDLVMAIVMNMQARRFPRDSKLIHRAIWELRQEISYNELLKDFTFAETKFGPFSDLLEKAILTMEQNGTLSWNQFDIYIIDDDVKRKKCKEINEKFKEQLPLVQSASADFQNKVCQNVDE